MSIDQNGQQRYMRGACADKHPALQVSSGHALIMVDEVDEATHKEFLEQIKKENDAQKARAQAGMQKKIAEAKNQEGKVINIPQGATPEEGAEKVTKEI